MASAAGKKVTARMYMELETKYAELDGELDDVKEKIGSITSDNEKLQAFRNDVTVKLAGAINRTDTRGKFLDREPERYIPWSAEQIEDQKATIARYSKMIDGQADQISNFGNIRAMCEAAIQKIGDEELYANCDSVGFIEEAAEELFIQRNHAKEVIRKIKLAVKALNAGDQVDMKRHTVYIPWSQKEILALRGEVEHFETSARAEKNRADTLADLLTQEKDKSAQLMQDNSLYQTNIAEAQRIYDEQQRKITQLEGIIRDRDITIDQQRSVISNAESSVDTYISTVRDLERQLSETNNNAVTGLEGQYQAELYHLNEQHNTETAGLRAKVASLQQRLAEETAAKEAAMKQQEEEKREKDTKLSSLMKNYTAAESGLKDQLAMERVEMGSRLSSLEDELNRQKAEAKSIQMGYEAKEKGIQAQWHTRFDAEMKTAKETIAKLVLQSKVDHRGNGEISIVSTMQIRHLEKENRELKERGNQLQDMIAGLKDQYAVKVGTLGDIMNVRMNTRQWMMEVKEAKDYAVRTKHAQEETLERNRGLDRQLALMTSQVRCLKSKNETLDKDVKSKKWEIARNQTEIARQSKEISRLSGALGVAERKAQLLKQQHEGVGGTLEKLNTTKELNDKKAIFDHQTTMMESSRKELEWIKEREYDFLTSQTHSVKANKQIVNLEKKNKTLEVLCEKQKDLLAQNKETIERIQGDRPYIVHMPPTTPADTGDRLKKLLAEPDHPLPRLSTATSLTQSLSPVMTVTDIVPVAAEPNETSNITENVAENGTNEVMSNAVESEKVFETENNEFEERETDTFSRWQMLFFVLLFIGTMISWAASPTPHTLKENLPRGDVCDMVEKPEGQLALDPALIMICAGNSDDYANLSLHDLNALNGFGISDS
ncbi:hypothetical protein L207DRAFT_625715 [Hyaloscypha variabilis F]|uniref:Uncharacterized protein n=1 Tax=Hyaloscypha variabilis (strain UAMH 11265 / GT02V1 / F) TaxID=1149755 RepID=A0A2J6RR46_HYAVF|nr:hypothetical protein L207DRAFT_625715 [Hyaloscypha variabilis F]